MKLYDIQEPGTNSDESFTTKNAVNGIVIGIDLGTTNSLIGYVESGHVKIIKDYKTGENFLPSVVAYQNGKKVLGHEARKSEGGTIIASAKRLMGKGQEEITEKELHSFNILPGTGAIRIQTPQGNITPTEVSAEILKRLKKSAEKYLGAEVKKAVITVPAYFGETARQATQDAARIAGIEVLRLISEPTAAAIAYGLEANPHGLYAVYDLGGGTFDISILRMQTGVLQVIVSGGDTRLGGDDIDMVLAKHLKDKHKLSSKITLHDLLKAREIKEHLTSYDVWLGAFMGAKVEVTKVELEEIARPLIDKTIACFVTALKDAEIEADDLNEIILVQGSHC